MIGRPILLPEHTRVAILVALPEELSFEASPELKGRFQIIYTGVGKVNAAYLTTKYVLSMRPSLLLNFGSAGRIAPNVSGLVEVSSVIQRDMAAEPLAPRGKTPFSNAPHELHSNQSGVRCGTGDSFVTSHDDWLQEQSVDIVDMELFAIAAVCEREGIPWRSFKYISDDANGDAGKDWSENLRAGQALLVEKLDAPCEFAA